NKPTTQYPSTPGFISNHWYGRWGQVNSGLLNMVKTYDLLTTQREETGGWSVSIAHKPEPADTA
ncbi:hypothetical protein VDQ50_21630, partial [Xanthomonas campestris pv. campestris]|nr:hypothetical protein [Xanthomonas campestris pv. campestris]MEB1441029.1 hypothetical protein [Xanthomonas campestris pv. campestris]